MSHDHRHGDRREGGDGPHAADQSVRSVDSSGEPGWATGTLWPGVLQLSKDFYETLLSHAVPLDYRALGALKHSSLALDIYTWLANRLCRINKPTGVRLSWFNLNEQFGSEYTHSSDFKREFRNALGQVRAVYSDARVAEVIGGIMLNQSRGTTREDANHRANCRFAVSGCGQVMG